MKGPNKDYATRTFYVDITTRPDYPNYLPFELRRDKVNLTDRLKPGQTVTVSYNLNGRPYDNTAKGGTKGIYLSLDAWRIDVVELTSAAVYQSAPPPAPAPTPAAQMAANPLPAFAPIAAGQEDALPF